MTEEYRELNTEQQRQKIKSMLLEAESTDYHLRLQIRVNEAIAGGQRDKVKRRQIDDAIAQDRAQLSSYQISREVLRAALAELPEETPAAEPPPAGEIDTETGEPVPAESPSA